MDGYFVVCAVLLMMNLFLLISRTSKGPVSFGKSHETSQSPYCHHIMRNRRDLVYTIYPSKKVAGVRAPLS